MGRRFEVQKKDVGEEEEKREIHDDVAEEHGDRSAPETAPAAEKEAPPHGGAALGCLTSRRRVSAKQMTCLITYLKH